MELLAQSNFSFLRGASSPEALVRRAAQLGHASLGLVDHMGYYGSARAHAEAQKVGIKAITGATLENVSSCRSLTILNKSRAAYQNLSRLLTSLHCKSKSDPLASHDLTGMHAVFTQRSLARLTKSDLLATVTRLQNYFGPGNLSLALSRHFLRGEEKRNLLFRDLAAHLKLPLLASNSPLYATRADRPLADASPAFANIAVSMTPAVYSKGMVSVS